MYTAKPAEIPGPVGQVAAIMRGEPQFVRGAKARELDRGMIRRVVRHLLLKGQSELVVTLVEPEAEQLVPGLASEVSAVVDSMG